MPENPLAASKANVGPALGNVWENAVCDSHTQQVRVERHDGGSTRAPIAQDVREDPEANSVQPLAHPQPPPLLGEVVEESEELYGESEANASDNAEQPGVHPQPSPLLADIVQEPEESHEDTVDAASHNAEQPVAHLQPPPLPARSFMLPKHLEPTRDVAEPSRTAQTPRDPHFRPDEPLTPANPIASHATTEEETRAPPLPTKILAPAFKAAPPNIEEWQRLKQPPPGDDATGRWWEEDPVEQAGQDTDSETYNRDQANVTEFFELSSQVADDLPADGQQEADNLAPACDHDAESDHGSLNSTVTESNYGLNFDEDPPSPQMALDLITHSPHLHDQDPEVMSASALSMNYAPPPAGRQRLLCVRLRWG